MLEEVILVDAHDTHIGTMEKLEAHEKGLLQITLLVFGKQKQKRQFKVSSMHGMQRVLMGYKTAFSTLDALTFFHLAKLGGDDAHEQFSRRIIINESGGDLAMNENDQQVVLCPVLCRLRRDLPLLTKIREYYNMTNLFY